MAHEHHHCDCSHVRLRFCRRCQVPHCLDCGKEWVTKASWSYWYPYYNPYGTGITGGGITYTGLSGNGGVNTGNLSVTNGTSTLTCQHEA